MNISRRNITVSDIPVEIVRKNIKNIHLGVYPPEGNVRISVPSHITNENVRLAIVSRLSWLKNGKKNLKSSHDRQSVNMLPVKAIIFKASVTYLK